MTRVIALVAVIATAFLVPTLIVSACASEVEAPGLEQHGAGPVASEDAGSSLQEGDATDESTAGSLRVDDAWVRVGPGGMGAAYFTLTGGRVANRLVSVSTSLARRAELHTTTHEGGTMRMRPVDVLEVPAGGVLTFEPGGSHVMLFDVEDAPPTGTMIPLTLHFEDGGRMEVQAEVRRP